MRRTWIEVIPPTLARWRIAARCSGEMSCFRAFDILPLHIPQKEQGEHQRCLRVAVGEHEQGRFCPPVGRKPRAASAQGPGNTSLLGCERGRVEPPRVLPPQDPESTGLAPWSRVAAKTLSPLTTLRRSRGLVRLISGTTMHN